MREVILVVDDEPMVLSIVSHILTRAGYVVLRAASPEEALAVARSHSAAIHLLLSDVMMPNLSGPSLAERIAELHPETGRLFMAGLPDSAKVSERILSRGLPFLPKPFAARTLLEKVREVLESANPMVTA
jgi:two-component system cell cycle sensor histidine kinase/response regulator CckA